MTRYYDFRKVVIDLIANFYKEQRPDLVPGLIARVNAGLASGPAGQAFAPLSEKEVQSYYQEDALIWRVYLAFRKLDRFFSRLTGRSYPYILPDGIRR